jgi:ZIP family zinc transporter
VGLGETVLLGFIAGVTIIFGLPLGRMRRPAPGLRMFLNAVAVGILLFLVWDVLSAAWEPIDAGLNRIHDGSGGGGTVAGYGALFIVGLSVGLLSLVAYERWMAALAKRQAAAPAYPQPQGFGPGAMHVDELQRPASGALRSMATWSTAKRLSLLIAIGIGLHNFAEGLAIGQSAATNELSLAIPLVIGFALHNATEGFGIVAPLAGDTLPDGGLIRPSWGFLLSMALIGGGPTFLGTIVGHSFTSTPVAVIFLTLAAGSIIYVITQLIGVAAKAKRADLLAAGLLVGLVLGFATDAIVTAAGA